MKPKLVKTVRKDLPVIAKVYKTEFSKPPYNEKWTMKKALDKMKFFMKNYDIYTIKSGKQIAGFVCVNPYFMCPGEVAFVEEIAIKEEFQGRGIGTFVLNQLFNIYGKRGFKKIMGIADTKGKPINLYKRLGILPSKRNVLTERKLK